MYRVAFLERDTEDSIGLYYAYFYEKPSHYDMLQWCERLPADIRTAVWHLPMKGVGKGHEDIVP